MNRRLVSRALPGSAVLASPSGTLADEGVFGDVRGSETLPRGTWDFDQWFTSRTDKGTGTYQALDTKTEFDYGVTDRLQASAALFGLGIDTQVIRIDAYVPKDEKYPWKPAGFEGAPIAGLPADFEWPTHPELEIEVTAADGVSYGFAPNWFVGAEFFYQTEHETEVGQECWSLQAGPTLHYGGRQWWATLTWMPQLHGGGTFHDGQVDTSLHLIEKTKQEIRLKVGYYF